MDKERALGSTILKEVSRKEIIEGTNHVKGYERKIRGGVSVKMIGVENSRKNWS